MYTLLLALEHLVDFPRATYKKVGRTNRSRPTFASQFPLDPQLVEVVLNLVLVLE